MIDLSKPTFTADEAAYILSCSTSMVYKLVRTEQLSAAKVGTRVIIPRTELVRMGVLGEESPDAA